MNELEFNRINAEKLSDLLCETDSLTYGIIKKFKNGTSLWYEPITDNLDGFVLRATDDDIIEIWK